MKSAEFLSIVLPETGFYCLATPYEKGGFRHPIFESIDEMVQMAQHLDANENRDVYFAVASLKSRGIKNPKTGKLSARTKNNIAALRAVFFDLDVDKPWDKPDPTKYTSKEEAIAATKRFCKELTWPPPMIVDSGWGHHLYWLLEEEVAPADYEVFAEKVKRIAQFLKYKLDKQCTDVSRILRVVNTRNHKNPDDTPRVVVTREMKERTTFEYLSAQVDAYIVSHDISVAGVRKKELPPPEYLSFGTDNVSKDYTPANHELIPEHCPAMKRLIETKGNVGYDLWYPGLSVLRLCVGGRELCHELSKGYPKYDPADTDSYLDGLEANNIWGMYCSSFRKRGVAECAECPNFAEKKSPIRFGREAKSFKDNAMDAEEAAAASAGIMPGPPFPYDVGGGGVKRRKRDKDGNEEITDIYDYDLVPVKRVFSERDKRELTLWKTYNESDGFVEIEMPSAALYEKRAFQTVMADCGMYCDLNKVDDLRDYMVSYVQVVQKYFKKEVLYSRMGWRDNNYFVYQDTVFDGANTYPCEVERSGRVVEALETKGTYEGWRDIVRFFEHEDFAAHQFAIATAFGAPLMQFTGVLGGIISIIGESGEGKSTVQKIVNSVWGHPIKLMLPAESKSSTYNAKISYITQLNNLPVCAEEITNASADDISSLAYSITQGSEKWRADIKGNVRESQGGWCTTMLASGNSPMHEKIHQSEGAGAKALRILEYRVHHVEKHSKSAFRQGVDLALLDHYGHAGRIFIAYVTANRESVIERIKQKMIYIDDKFSMMPQERIWTAVVATNMVGAEIAVELGLVSFNISAIYHFITGLLTELRSTVSDLAITAEDAIAQYLQENVHSLLTVDTKQQGELFPEHRPSREIAIRYEKPALDLYISASHLKKWVNNVGMSYSKLISDLDKLGVLENKSERYTLGKGTNIPTTQSRVVHLKVKDDLLKRKLEVVSSFGTNIGAKR